MEKLPTDILCDIFRRCPFQAKRALSLVCKQFEKLLNQPPTCDLWGTVSIDMDKLENQSYQCATAGVVSSMQWLGSLAAGVSCIHLQANTSQLVGFALGALAGSLYSASHLPALEMHIEGENCGFLQADIFSKEGLTLRLLLRLRVLQLRSAEGFTYEDLWAIPQLVGLEELELIAVENEEDRRVIDLPTEAEPHLIDADWQFNYDLRRGVRKFAVRFQYDMETLLETQPLYSLWQDVFAVNGVTAPIVY
ncbi:hypothetical protein WJX72_007686 [[Myrmecia] bisecta]|uniref:F-box domain-containing protein n=1 Tax=[Myrmecia] bisecta TaxID=41462 RepID=A0AAW1R7L5_9CHLO